MEFSKKLSEFICYNQQKLIEFEYTISEYHKDIRVAIEKDKDTIDEKLLKFYSVTKKILNDVFTENINFIDSYFNIVKNERFKTEIKLFFWNSDTEKAFDYFGEKENNHPKTKEAISEIIKQRKHFLNKEKELLVIPMKLKDQVDEEAFDKFLDNFYQDKTNSHIWGFVSIELKNKHIFDLKDINISYIFTDILSLYFAFLYIHTEISITFKKAIEVLMRNDN